MRAIREFSLFRTFFLPNAEILRFIDPVASRQRNHQPPTNQPTMKTYTITSNLRVVRGSYQHASDDRIDRWYIDTANGPVDRRGRGYRTRRLALDALAAIEAGMDWTAMPTD